MTHEPFPRLLREAAEPDLAPGAAERIAEGAWSRAAELRREAAPGPRSRRVARRFAVPAAIAAAVVAALVLVVRASEPAFAVEGDPVQVLRGGDWTNEASRVPVGRWVFVPRGAHTSVRGAAGCVIDPKPGAVFRIVANAADSSAWRVELRNGDAEVAGRSLVLTLSDAMEVAPTADASTEHALLRIAASFGAALDVPPPYGFRDAVAAGAPSVRMLEGTARVANLHDAGFLLLRREQAATWMRTNDGAGGASRTRLLQELAWSPALASDMLRGARVVGAAERGAGSFTFALSFPGADHRAVVVPSLLRREACDQIGLVSMQIARLRLAAHAEVALEDGHARAEYEHTTSDGSRRTRIVVDAEGRATLERAGEEPRVFDSLDELRREAPDAAALFGEKLE